MGAIQRALISVSDKSGIVEFAGQLHNAGVEILSTGGTARLLSDNSIPVIEVSDYTGFPEMMAGRVKTLHPKVHGGILGRRGTDDGVMKEQNIAEQKKAEALLQESDRVRAAFIQSWYGIRWDTASTFDLVIDTDKVPRELAVTWVVQAHDALKEKQDGEKPTANTIQIDPILAEVVTKETQF